MNQSFRLCPHPRLDSALTAFALLFLLAAPRAVPRPLPFSLKLTQTIDSDLASSTGATFRSDVLDGAIRWTAEDVADGIGSARLRPETWSVRAKPLPEIAILTGSVSYSGLPARANNSVFSVSSPFRKPLEADGAALLSTGVSRKTGTVAAEIRSGAWDIAGYSALPGDPDGTTWLSCSATRESFSRPDTNISVAAFSGNRKTPKRSDDSWTVDRPDVPGTALSVAGGEIAFRLGEIGGSATFLANAGRAKAIRSMGRGELYLDAGPVFVSSGYYRSDRDYRELDGSCPSVLSRFFFAPQVRVCAWDNGASSVRTGAILCHDVRAGEKFWYGNEDRTSGGLGLEIDANTLYGFSAFMATKETLSAEASLRMDALFTRALKPSLSANITWKNDDGTRPRPEKLSPGATLTWVPVERRRMSFRMILGYKGTVALPDAVTGNEFSLVAEQSFLGSHGSAKLSLGATHDAGKSKSALSLTATLALR